MKKIWKYQLSNKAFQQIEIPKSSKILTIQEQKGTPCVWVEVDDSIKTMVKWDIYKIRLEIAKYFEVELPEIARIIKVDVADHEPYILAEAEGSNENIITRKFGFIGTGGNVRSEDANYIGTIQYNNGEFVQHLYEFLEDENKKTEKVIVQYENVPAIIDKIRGIVYGHAIGDAIGLGTEFMDKSQIANFYPGGYKNYDQMVLDKHRSRWQKGEWTDDTDQMLCILESILAKKQVDEVDIAKRIYQWAFSGGRGIGQTVYKSLNDPVFLFNPHRVAEKVWLDSGKLAAANGAVMRTSILGVWDYQNFEQLKQNTEKAAKITHFDPRCVGSCVAVTFVISELLKGETDLSKLTDLAIEKTSIYDKSIEGYLQTAKSKPLDTLKLDEAKSIGYTLKALGAGFWALQQNGFKTAILEIVNQGGDADTNGAVAGGILGAKLGFSGLPQDWIAGLLNKEKLNGLIDSFIELMKETGQL